MFRDLYDFISLAFSWRWPRTEGVVTAVHLGVAGRDGPQALVTYEFSLGDDGPYTGESPWFGDEVFLNSLVGQTVVVRYRKDDPSVNRVDDSRSL
jgi:hypothetical protein